MEEHFERWRALAVDAIAEAPSLGALLGAAAGACLRQLPEARIPTTMYHARGGPLDGQVMALRLLASIDRDPRWHPGEVATRQGIGDLVMLADGTFIVLGGIDPDISVILGESVSAEDRRTRGASIISVGNAPVMRDMPKPDAMRPWSWESTPSRCLFGRRLVRPGMAPRWRRSSPDTAWRARDFARQRRRTLSGIWRSWKSMQTRPWPWPPRDWFSQKKSWTRFLSSPTKF